MRRAVNPAGKSAATRFEARAVLSPLKYKIKRDSGFTMFYRCLLWAWGLYFWSCWHVGRVTRLAEGCILQKSGRTHQAKPVA